MKKIVIAYVPVLHKGYMDLFRKTQADDLYIISNEIISQIAEVEYIKRKDSLRALDPELIKIAIESFGIFGKVEILYSHSHAILELSREESSIIMMPDEDISRLIAQKYFPYRAVIFDPIFLRWHKDNVSRDMPVNTDRTISMSQFEKEIMQDAFSESKKSLDWYRQVGAIIIKDEKPVLIGHNEHVPHPQAPYAFGDPRSVFKRGIHIELASAEHAEASLIAQAAKRGITLDGAWIFVTTFPCPPCAYLIAGSGIKRCYFNQGYSLIHGQDEMRVRGVELIYINEKASS